LVSANETFLEWVQMSSPVFLHLFLDSSRLLYITLLMAHSNDHAQSLGVDGLSPTPLQASNSVVLMLSSSNSITSNLEDLGSTLAVGQIHPK
jgi:hypothetical protein